MSDHGTEHHVCKCTASGVTQTLDEMDWERGIWYAERKILVHALGFDLTTSRLGGSASPPRLRPLYKAEVQNLSKSYHSRLNSDINTLAKALTALLGDAVRVTELLQRDGAARATDNSGYTALHYAARSGHTHICKSLLEHGAYIDAQTKSGRSTSLHRAAAAGKLQTVKFLLSCGACPETIDADGQTALHRAAQFNHLDIISTLLESSPIIEDVKDSKGRTAHDLLLGRC